MPKTIDVSLLTSEERQRIGQRMGGLSTARRHPELAKQRGAAGGKAAAKAHPERRTSAHGRALALAKKLKNQTYAAALAAELSANTGRDATSKKERVNGRRK